VERMRIEQVRLQEDAQQGRRLQAVLHFKEQFISETLAAQVIGSSGSEQSRVIYIDKGSNDGLKTNMPVITPEGVVGKIVQPLANTSVVLLVTDPAWGVGGVLEKSRLQGIAKGTPGGDLKFSNILADEKVEAGEHVLTSGGDGIFPKGLPLATVSELLKREDMFLNIRLAPAANLGKLEEVLVITKLAEKPPTAEEIAAGPVRAADVLAQRLPSVPKTVIAPAASAAQPAANRPAVGGQAAANTKVAPKPNQTQQPKIEPKPVEGTPTPQAARDNPR
jgi:rod shape-determining protein MreC